MVANRLAALLNADIEHIECPRYRSSWFPYLLAGYDIVKGRLPSIELPDVSAEGYDLLLLGATIWTGYPAVPLRIPIAQNRKFPPRV